MNEYKLFTILLIIIISINSNVFNSEQLLKTRDRLIYDKSIEIKSYTDIVEETIYSTILRGNCFEESIYIVMGADRYGFSIEKKLLKKINLSSSRIVCDYLKIIDNGNAYTLRVNDSISGEILYFTRDFQYSGPLFHTIDYSGVPLPWISNVYMYIPPRFARDVREYETSVSSSKVINGKVINFYYLLDLRYDIDSGFLKKLNCLITIYLDRKPYMLINIVIEEKQINIFNVLFNYFVETILYYWKYIVAVVLTITAVIVIYRKI